jgi:hypothetical protein
MLDRESQGLDLQELRLTQQSVDIDTQGMSSELGIQASAQNPKGL